MMTDLKSNDITVSVPAAAGAVGFEMSEYYRIFIRFVYLLSYDYGF
jgi:hypothetical protein